VVYQKNKIRISPIAPGKINNDICPRLKIQASSLIKDVFLNCGWFRKFPDGKPQIAFALLGFPFFNRSHFSLFLQNSTRINRTVMLSGLFYDIQTVTKEESVDIQYKFCAVVALNDSHPIYKGHFPGNPVVPGACQVQMVRELIEKVVAHPVRLTESDNIKFLSMINPRNNPQLEIKIEIKPYTGNDIAVTASIGSGAVVFSKFKGKFQIEA
jgi:3-hydroxyacyl-[acyl-carrier-protein] dehydratase